MASNKNLPDTENREYNKYIMRIKINQTKVAEMLQLGDRNIVETVFLMLKILRRGKKDIVVVAQSLSHVQLFATPLTVACEASLSLSPWVC